MYGFDYSQGRELPEVSFRQIDLPELINWEVNGEYYLVIKVKMTGKHDMDHLPEKHDRNKLVGEFKIKSVRAMDDKPIDAVSLEKADFEAIIVKARSGQYV